ncbi:MAG: hypothetical protein IJQ82_01785, partial [Selenomonadaceae bacterium]|nr:hypothetical protein [Selenomonadaceae bacterium]
NGGASELTYTAWALLRYLQGFATIFTGLCYDIYISKEKLSTTISQNLVASPLDKNAIVNLLWALLPITISPLVNYYSAHGTLPFHRWSDIGYNYRKFDK